MPRKKDKLVRVTAVEILPPESSSSLLVEQDARLQRLVQEEVARILAQKENNLLQPWFTSSAFALVHFFGFRPRSSPPADSRREIQVCGFL